MSDETRVTLRSRLGQVLAFARSAEPRVIPSRRAILADVLLAAGVMAASLALARLSIIGGIPTRAVVAAVVTSVPLAARRRFPLSACAVLVLGAIATRRDATDVTFLAVVFAAYSAVVYSRFRGAAQLCVPLVGVIVAAAFWKASPSASVSSAEPVGPHGPATRSPVPLPLGRPIAPQLVHGLPGAPGVLDAPWRLAAIMVLLSLVLIAIVGNAVHAGDRIRRLQAEHETATRRAVDLERARIASELHDVVTHNVSVMIVQAGAARQVLGDSPDQARAALLAVESSGRSAMTELRHLLGLLSPFRAQGDDPSGTGLPGAGLPRAGLPGVGLARAGLAGAGLARDGLAAAGPAGPGEPAVGAARDSAEASAADLEPSHELRPQPGLGQLQSLVDRVAATGVPIELQVGDLPDSLPPGLDLAAYRVVQEALTNVIKHAGKSRTRIRLDYRAGDLVVEVTDAGRLIPAAGPQATGGGRGLLGLRERMALYGGGLHAGPNPGGGWVVRARLPVDPRWAPVLCTGQAEQDDPAPEVAKLR